MALTGGGTQTPNPWTTVSAKAFLKGVYDDKVIQAMSGKEAISKASSHKWQRCYELLKEHKAKF